MMNKAIFAGSFDPFTMGHLDTVERASHIFDEIIIAVATNISKSQLFSPEERIQLIKEATSDYDNIQVINHTEGLTIDLADKMGANVLIRGVRSVKDYEYEADIATMNYAQNDNVETLLMIASPQYSFISSSMIKEISKFNGDISGFVPLNVEAALKEKYKNLKK